MNRTARKVYPIDTKRSEEASQDFLGPARVVEVSPHRLSVEVRGGENVTAVMALAFPYAPAVDDVLLVIGRGDEHYVIGVLQGSGATTLSLPGAVELRARGGPLTLSSDQGVALRGPEVEIEAGKLRMVAGAVAQKFTSLYQRVRDSLHLHAGQTHTIVEDRSFMTAKNASIVTQETMSINGSEIHLG